MEEEALALPLPVNFRRARHVYTVKSTREIVELLTDPLWPRRGPAHRRACALVLARSYNPETVSLQEICDAFTAAVEEADQIDDIPVDVECDKLH